MTDSEKKTAEAEEIKEEESQAGQQEQTEDVPEQEINITEEDTQDTEEKEAENTGEKEKKPEKKERKLKWAKNTDELEEKLGEANDKFARLFAEFDNYRKRSEKEKSQRYDFGAKDMVEKILPVIDNFERGLAAVPEDKADDAFVKGMEMTYKQLLKVLEDAGVKVIEAVGQKFDPEYHNAVMHVDDPEVEDNMVVEEFQKGYLYKDHVVRYSMVKVAN